MRGSSLHPKALSQPQQPPRNYVPGIGRGAAGFTTRSDVGPAAPAVEASVVGSRSAQARQQQQQQQQQQQSVLAAFGAAPANYIAGAGRGAGAAAAAVGSYDPFGGYANSGSRQTQSPAAAAAAAVDGQRYDQDDDQADQVWAAIDERVRNKRRKRNQDNDNDHHDSTNNAEEDSGRKQARARIGAQFRELKDKLATVTEDQWASIPDVGDYSLKYKQPKRPDHFDVFTPLTDSILEQRSRANMDATAGNAVLAGTTTAAGGRAVMMDGDINGGGFKSVVTNMSGLSAARGTVLSMSLDRMSGQATMMATGQASSASTGAGTTIANSNNNTVDPQGYLTSLSQTQIATTAQVADIHKARLLLKSVRQTNQKHGPGWIASARVEEAAGKTLQARKIIQEACQICPDHEDVWLEAARLHPLPVAKSILAMAVRRIPTSVKIFLKAADLEHTVAGKKAVLRKALEANPTSVTLWKAAIELEDAPDARILLSVAVEKIPHSVDMWLALARLETYANAQKVLNKARKALPADRSIWIAAAKLEESQNHNTVVDKVIERAVRSLEKNQAVVTRAQWLQEAEAAEAASAPDTSAAIVKYTIGKDVEAEDRQRTWSEDAKGAMARGAIATARAILSHALAAFPTKQSLWTQAVDLERRHGSAASLDEVLAAASERLPHIEIFWLLRAKERWMGGQVEMAREILTKAFAANPESEAVWLAAAKLEWENGEIDRARYFLERARERAPTDRVYMKSALLEREEEKYEDALRLIEEGIEKYPTFPKLYMMAGQICSDSLPKTKSSLERARKFCERGLQQCPNNAVLWTLASRLEERAATFEENNMTAKAGVGETKARSLLELARLKNPKTPQLWLESIRLERRAGNTKLAETLMARALQECPTAGVLLAENIMAAPRVEQKSKSAVGIKRCPDDPLVIAAVASLFASERKNDKARKWFDRAAILNPDIGDTWARYYAFELQAGTKEQQDKVKERCVAAGPKHGERWTSFMKDTANGNKSVAEGLEAVAELISASQQLKNAPASN